MTAMCTDSAPEIGRGNLGADTLFTEQGLDGAGSYLYASQPSLQEVPLLQTSALFKAAVQPVARPQSPGKPRRHVPGDDAR
jgi:hypothetical protein